jgi:hypothetical protein
MIFSNFLSKYNFQPNDSIPPPPPPPKKKKKTPPFSLFSFPPNTKLIFILFYFWSSELKLISYYGPFYYWIYLLNMGNTITEAGIATWSPLNASLFHSFMSK